MKKTVSLLLCCLLLFTLFGTPTFSAAPSALHWYCIREKDHKQPRTPAELRFVEEYGGYHIDHRHGDDNPDKVVYLTFDAGYENGNVAKTLDILKEQEVPAAFFVLKHLVEDAPTLIKRMAEEGHFVCNHTAHHKDLSRSSKETVKNEILELEDAVKAVIGEGTKTYFRPPEGNFSREMLESVHALGYRTVFWSFAYADWDNDRQPKAEAAKEKILTNVHNGAVILLHPTSATNVQILGEVIEALKGEGYRFDTLDELCAAR